jgi:hypothetical protein
MYKVEFIGVWFNKRGGNCIWAGGGLLNVIDNIVGWLQTFVPDVEPVIETFH